MFGEGDCRSGTKIAKFLTRALHRIKCKLQANFQKKVNQPIRFKLTAVVGFSLTFENVYKVTKSMRL